MNLQRRTTTVIMAIAVIAGLGMVSSGHTMTPAYGFQQPYISAPTPFNPPTSLPPSASYLGIPDAQGAPHMCMMVNLPAASPTSGPGGTYIYDMVQFPTTAPTTLAQATQFTGWCAQQNVTDGDGVGEVITSANNPMGLDVNHPCWVQNGIGYYGDCDVAPVRGYTQGNYTYGWQKAANEPALPANGGIPTEEWFHLSGVDLKPGAFLDLADTTPWYTTHGHMAMVLPCEKDGTPDLRLYQGIIDGGVFTMEAPTMQYLQHISDPSNHLCVYHFDIGVKADADAPYMGDSNGHPAQTMESANPYGVTDFALVNTSGSSQNLSKDLERYTSTFSIATGFMNVIG